MGEPQTLKKLKEKHDELIDDIFKNLYEGISNERTNDMHKTIKFNYDSLKTRLKNIAPKEVEHVYDALSESKLIKALFEADKKLNKALKDLMKDPQLKDTAVEFARIMEEFAYTQHLILGMQNIRTIVQAHDTDPTAVKLKSGRYNKDIASTADKLTGKVSKDTIKIITDLFRAVSSKVHSLNSVLEHYSIHVQSDYDFHPIGIVVSDLEGLMSKQAASTLAHSMIWPVARGKAISSASSSATTTAATTSSTTSSTTTKKP